MDFTRNGPLFKEFAPVCLLPPGGNVELLVKAYVKATFNPDSPIPVMLAAMPGGRWAESIATASLMQEVRPAWQDPKYGQPTGRNILLTAPPLQIR